MKKEKSQGIGFFEKYLSIWVIICMVVGVLIGKFLPSIPDFLGKFEYANVSIPIAILIWLMIFPMMLKVDFKSIKYVGKNPKGLFGWSGTTWSGTMYCNGICLEPFVQRKSSLYGCASGN